MSDSIQPRRAVPMSITVTNRTYDALKWVAQYLLPGLGTLYFALASIWGLPYPDKVVGTIVALDAFLGLLLGLSTAGYNAEDSNYDGVLRIDNSDPAKTLWSFEPSEDLDSIKDQKTMTFKVDNSQ